MSRLCTGSRLTRKLSLGALWALLGCGLSGDPRLPAAAVEPQRGAVPDRAAEAQLRPTLPEPSPPSAAGFTGPEPAGAQPIAPRVSWRFQSAAPVSGVPGVTESGLVYVATVEGYVHALGPDGGFRWSYGLSGMPIGSPAVDRAGHAYVATTARRLYSLHPDGRLNWMQLTAARVVTAPIWAAPGVLYYTARDQRLYALAGWGGQLYSRQLGRPAAVAPASLAEGWVAVGTLGADVWLFHGASRARRLELEGGLSQPLLASEEHWYAVAKGQLSAFDRADGSVTWRAPARHAALSADAELLLVEAGGQLIWLSPRTGHEEHRLPFDGDSSAAPVLTNGGIALIPMVSGELLVADPHASLVARVRVASSPLWQPSWSERSQRATVASGGVVVEVDLRGWPSAAKEDPSGTHLEGVPGRARSTPPTSESSAAGASDALSVVIPGGA